MIDTISRGGSVYRASGKVLLAGGYGVLEEGNFGLSLAINKHFYSRTCLQQSASQADIIVIEVKSPQIKGHWIYHYNFDRQSIEETKVQSNVFVENAVKFALIYGLTNSTKKVSAISIDIVFDRGFLSESASQNSNQPMFMNYEGTSAKTGLGSSACVVVAIVGGILTQFLRGESEISQNQVNVVSQVANVAAQNKIGSNFDISTAVYGSQLYKNVLPRRAFQAVEQKTLKQITNIDPEIKRLSPNPVITKYASAWLLDLKIGSNTRTMVTGFIKALNTQPIDVIQDFYLNNKLFVTQLYRLLCSDLSLSELTVSCKALNKEYRKFLQKYSQMTKVPVEPSEFNELLDEISSLEGIIYCICPGSGGYDAIAVLAITPDKNQLKEDMGQICKKRHVECQIQQVDVEWQSLPCRSEEVQLVQQYLETSRIGL